MKRWYLYLIIVPLVLVALVYLIVRLTSPINFADMWGKNNQARTTQRTVGKLPDVGVAPREVLALRRAHQLRALTEREDGMKVQDLPNGIYGFATCKVESLSAKRGNTFALEIHKHDDGIVYYVGYASEEDIGKYLALQKNFHIVTFPHSSEKATSLFEIPVEFVSKCEARSVADGYLYDLFVTNIPLMQS
jgi:hypothetical protein